MIIPLIQVTASTKAQTITLNKQNISLTAVFEEIMNQTNYDFVYSEQQISKVGRLNIFLTNASIIDVLDKCFQSQPLTYSIKGKNVIIEAKKTSLFQHLIDKMSDIDVQGTIVDEKGTPLVGATVKVKETTTTTTTDNQGIFFIRNVAEDAILVISFIGYQTKELYVSANIGTVKLVVSAGQLNEVVVSTGYQTISRDKTTGSFVQIDNKLLNRSVSSNILDRLRNLTPGVFFRAANELQSVPVTRNPNQKNSLITIRGESTFAASKEPLIILDNFPYEGEIRNLNPNDIESVTVLKDASSASIWGARSANGVIVITTKKGRLNQRTQVEFNSSVTVSDKPDLNYSFNFLDSKSFIEAEQFLFDKGYFNLHLSNATVYPTISPAVELMSKYRASTNEVEKLALAAELESLKKLDVREDYEKYIYQNAVSQQYSLGLRGGTESLTYSLSVGADKNKNSLRNNGYSRVSVNSLNTYSPIQNLELTAGINYSQNTTSANNDFEFGTYSSSGYLYSGIFPYAQLADQDGNALPVLQGLRTPYQKIAESKGFLDWNYRPVDEIRLADNNTFVKALLLRTGLKYQIFRNLLNVQVNYQRESQLIDGRNYRSVDTYYARNLINKFSLYDPASGAITYNFPKGGILDIQHTEWLQDNLRAQINFNKDLGRHALNGIAGSEIREFKTEAFNRTSYGYDHQFGTATNALSYTTAYPTNPIGSALLPATDGFVTGIVNRNVSYYVVGNYVFDNKYILNASARTDGANLFGAKTNDKFKPFWSVGAGWNITSESFFKVSWIPQLRLRATYGYQGNTYLLGSAYLTGFYEPNFETGAESITSASAPNPRLRWEKVSNFNLGLDFGLFNNVISGSVELYQKRATDLIQPTALAPQTGFESYQANTASTKTRGIDINLTSINLKGRLKWNTTLFYSSLKDEVTKYDIPRNSGSISSAGLAIGKPLNALFSYQWAGLNPENGNPRGYLNGRDSEDYTAIINNFSTDSLAYSGSMIPTKYGALRNDFSFKGFNLSVNISYRLGYVFRRTTTSLNYSEVILSGHRDYNARWQKPGDESRTDVPSLVYPANANRNYFYRNSEVLIESGDHIRLQDIRFGYEFPTLFKRLKYSKLNLFCLANNLGIIWKKNKLGIDPSAGAYLAPRTISFGLNTNF